MKMPVQSIVGPEDLLQAIRVRPTPNDHVARLTMEMSNLQRQIRVLNRAHIAAYKDCHWYKAHYAYIMKKHVNFLKKLPVRREELYCKSTHHSCACPGTLPILPAPADIAASPSQDAVLSDKPERINKAEINLIQTQEDFHANQLRIPEALKKHAKHVQHFEAYESAIRDKHDLMSRKLEEMHRYRPCNKLLRCCDHCHDREEEERDIRESGPVQRRPEYLGQIGLEVPVEEEVEDLMEAMEHKTPNKEGEMMFQGLMGRIVKKVRKFKSMHF